MWASALLLVAATAVLAVVVTVVLALSGVVIVLAGFVLAVRDAVRDHRATSREQSMMVLPDQPQEES